MKSLILQQARLFSLAALAVLLTSCDAPKQNGPTSSAADTPELWSSFVTVDQVKARLGQPGVVIVDARSKEAYAAGHIKGAISLPGSSLRTGKAKPGEGDSQYFFRQADGTPDVAKYEQILGNAGISVDSEVIVYGNHAGKGDGSIPAMVLSWLGVEKIFFLDGVGLDRWKAAGNEVATESLELPATEFKATAKGGFVMNLDEVISAAKDKSVYFMDTRSLDEYTGADKRDNVRGGHIPGAIRLDYNDLLNDDKSVKSPAEVAAILEERGVPKDKPICMYCQTATRVSLNYFVLRDLGYDNVVIYDASWHEYGNVDGALIIEGEAAE